MEFVPDMRYRDGVGGLLETGKRKGFSPPKGLFIEKPFHKYGQRRGKDICSICLGTCCSALRELIGGLIESGELPPDCKVREFVKEFVMD